MDIEGFRKVGYKAIDDICDHFYGLAKQPVVAQVEPGYLGKFLPSEAPVDGELFQTISDDFQKLIHPGITHWSHSSFFAYFPAACSFEGIFADLLSSSVSNPGFNWVCSPACTELEAIVMDWAAKLLGLNDDFLVASGKGGGVIQTSASDSVLVAVIAARFKFMSANPTTPLERLVVYGTTQTHSVGAKAALILGLKFRALSVTSKENYALRGDTLKQALEEDRRDGNFPFVLIGTIGTTDSGAVDKIDVIGVMLREYPSIWLHIDAAWAGVAFACPEFREEYQLKGVNTYADSFCTNFHKWGLVNFDASQLWVRDRRSLTEALDVTPAYLRNKQSDSGTVIDYRNWQLPLGRRFRSLKMWFVLRSFGVKRFPGAYSKGGIALNNLFVSEIKRHPLFSLVAVTSLSLSVIRLLPRQIPDHSLSSLNNLNRQFYARLSARPDIFLTHTELLGVHCVRFAIGAERTTEEDIRNAIRILKEEGENTLANWREDGGTL